jgi:acyl homoserine lactone synthase
MLTDTFPQLMAGEPAPRRSDVWELSRFAVQPPRDHDQHAQATSSALTLQMLRAGYLFGVDNGISEYVTVASVAMERLLRHIGLPMQRFGDGKPRRLGRVSSVAVHIPIGEELRAALFDSKAAIEAARQVA